MNVKSLFLGAAMLLSAFGGAQAQDADFRLVNATGYSIREVYVSPTGTETWGKDRLGDTVLEDGKARTMRFPKDAAFCVQDLMVVYDDDESKVVWKGVNVCELSAIKLMYDRKTDKTTAVAE